jgi:hypothetical protein
MAIDMSVVALCFVLPCSLVGDYQYSSETHVSTYKTTHCHNREDQPMDTTLVAHKRATAQIQVRLYTAELISSV